MPISSRFADQMIGIIKLERQAEHSGDRRERDVALVPVEPDADDLAPVPAAPAYHAAVDHGRRIRAGFRAGEPEAGNLLAARQPRQPIILLRLGTELEQQLAGSERVRHHGGDRAGERAGRQLADHFRMGIGGEAEAAVGLRNDHGEKFLALEVLPDLGRQITQLPIDLPVVEHAAELFDGSVEKRLLFGSQCCGGKREQLRPVGIAAEKIGIPPDVARFDRLALGVGQARQHLAGPAEDRLGDPVPAKRGGSHGKFRGSATTIRAGRAEA